MKRFNSREMMAFNKRKSKANTNSHEMWIIYDSVTQRKEYYTMNDVFLLYMNGRVNQNTFVLHSKDTNNSWVMLGKTKYYKSLKKYKEMFTKSVGNYKPTIRRQLSVDIEEQFGNIRKRGNTVMSQISVIENRDVGGKLNIIRNAETGGNESDEDAFIDGLIYDIDESSGKRITVCGCVYVAGQKYTHFNIYRFWIILIMIVIQKLYRL